MTSIEKHDQYQPRPAYDDEIDLVELWLILWRRKWIIASVFILILAMGGTYLSLTKPVYESKVRLMVGRVQNVGTIEQSDRISADLSEKLEAPLNRETVLISAETIGRSNIFEITVQGENPSATYETAEKLAIQVVNDHSDQFYRISNPVRKKLSFVQEQIHAVQNLLQKFESPHAPEESSLDTLLLLEKSRLLTELSSLEQMQMELQIQLDPVNTYPTTILSPAEYPEKPIKPKTSLIMALSTVLGLMIGVFAAFGLEFIQNVRKRMNIENKN